MAIGYNSIYSMAIGDNILYSYYIYIYIYIYTHMYI